MEIENKSKAYQTKNIFCSVNTLPIKYTIKRCYWVYSITISIFKFVGAGKVYTGELGYDGLSGTRNIGPSYAKSVICI